jgi:hypothetical protein
MQASPGLDWEMNPARKTGQLAVAFGRETGCEVLEE